MLTLNNLFIKKLYEQEILNIIYSSNNNFVKLDKAVFNKTITLRWLIYNKNFVINNLIKTLKQGKLKTPIAIERTVNIEGKNRQMYFFDWHIRLLHGVLSRILTAELENILPPNITSYRKGFNIFDTVKETGMYLKEYSLKKKSLNTVEKSVIRKDIKSYGDSIDINTLCSIVKKYISLDEKLYKVICKNLMFNYISETTGYIENKKVGLPTGSPLNTVFTNLYLIELDKEIIEAGFFYRRYGDDLIIIGDKLEKVENILEKHRLKLHLTFNEKKEGWVQTNTGFFKRFSPKMLRYLGFMIDFNGNIYPTTEKDLKIKNSIIKTIQKTYLSSRKDVKDKELQVRMLINSVNITIVHSNLKTDIYQLIGTVSDNYLKELDTWIATSILKFVFHKNANSVFKYYSFRKLRKNGLLSLRNIKTLLLYNTKSLKNYTDISI